MPKIRGGSLEEHRQRTRSEIFEAFARLLKVRTFDTISLADIAAEAAVGRTAIYNHFPDKEAVVLAFATEETEQYIARLEESLVDAEGPVAAMRMYVRNHLAMSKDLHLGLGPALYGMLSPGSLLEIRTHVQMVERVVRGILQDGIASGDFVDQDVDSAVTLVHSTLHSASERLPADDIEGFLLRALGARLS